MYPSELSATLPEVLPFGCQGPGGRPIRDPPRSPAALLTRQGSKRWVQPQ